MQNVAKWHAHGLIHRDLSATNVGMGPKRTVLIWDFYTIDQRATCQ